MITQSSTTRKKRHTEYIRDRRGERRYIECFAHLLRHDTSFSFQICVALFLSVQFPLILDLDVVDLPLLVLLYLLYDLFKFADLLLCILLTLDKVKVRK